MRFLTVKIGSKIFPSLERSFSKQFILTPENRERERIYTLANRHIQPLTNYASSTVPHPGHLWGWGCHPVSAGSKPAATEPCPCQGITATARHFPISWGTGRSLFASRNNPSHGANGSTDRCVMFQPVAERRPDRAAAQSQKNRPPRHLSPEGTE